MILQQQDSSDDNDMSSDDVEFPNQVRYRQQEIDQLDWIN
jgi:hypothetical protein